MRWPDGVSALAALAMRTRSRLAPSIICARAAKESTDPDGEKVTCDKKNGYGFSVLTRTIFEDTKIPLKIWYHIAYLILTAKKGISALQIHRVVFGETSTHDYHTTWYILSPLACSHEERSNSADRRNRIEKPTLAAKRRICTPVQRKALDLTGTKNKVGVIGAIACKGNDRPQSYREH